jgi:transcriptional regulator with XRE-family HTH domain
VSADLKSINARAINTKRIASALKRARLSAGLGVRQSAPLCGIAPNNICSLEKGLRMPDLYTIEKLATAYGVTVASLFADEGDVT